MELQTLQAELDGLFRRGEYDKVEPFLLHHIQAADAAREKAVSLSLLNELMGFYRSLSRFADSLRVAERTLQLIAEMGLAGSVHEATTLLNVATAYRADGQNEKAIAQYEAAERLFALNGVADPFLVATLHNNLSLAWQALGEHDKAISRLELALVLVRQRPDGAADVAVTLTNLALSRIRLGRLSEARANLLEAVRLFEAQARVSGHYSAALAALGEVCYRTADIDGAVACYERALREIEARYGRNMNYAVTLESLALVLEVRDPARCAALRDEAQALDAMLRQA